MMVLTDVKLSGQNYCEQVWSNIDKRKGLVEQNKEEKNSWKQKCLTRDKFYIFEQNGIADKRTMYVAKLHKNWLIDCHNNNWNCCLAFNKVYL